MVKGVCADVGYLCLWYKSFLKNGLLPTCLKWHSGSTRESVSALFSSFRRDLKPAGSSAATSVTTLSLPCATLSVALLQASLWSHCELDWETPVVEK